MPTSAEIRQMVIDALSEMEESEEEISEAEAIEIGPSHANWVITYSTKPGGPEAD